MSEATAPHGVRQFRPLDAVLLLLGIGGVLELLASLFLAQERSWDQRWYLYAAERVLDGLQLYGPRLTETNPPLIIWFSMVPIALAHLLHIAPVTALRLVVLLLIAGGVAWIARLLRLLQPEMPPVVRGLLLCSVAFVELWIDPSDFGQREQVLVILLLPYVLAAAIDGVRRLATAESLALGVVAGIAVCFKPQQTLVIVFLEIFLALRRRTLRRALRPEFLALVATVAGYLLAIRLASPLYFSQVLPALVDTYWAFGKHSASWLALHEPPREQALLLIVLVVSSFWRRLRTSPVPLTLAVCSVASLLAFCIQRTGWPYQQYPSWAWFCLAALWLLAELLPSLEQRLSGWATSRAGPATVAAGAVVLLLLFSIKLRRHPFQPLTDEVAVRAELAQYPPHTPVYVFTTNLAAFAVVLDHDLVWGSRFAHLWMLPAIVQNTMGRTSASIPFKALTPERVASLTATQRADTAEDLDLWKPQVVLVQHCAVADLCQGIEGKNFDLLAWFEESPQFNSAWSHYRKQKTLPKFDVYTRID